MEGIGKATACAFCKKISYIFILMGPMITQADTMTCAGWTEVAANWIGMKCDENNIPKAAWDDGEFDDRRFIADLFMD